MNKELERTVIQELLFSATDSFQTKPIFENYSQMASFLISEPDCPYYNRKEYSVNTSLRHEIGTNDPYRSPFKMAMKFIILPKLCKSDNIKELILKELDQKTPSSKKVKWEFPEKLTVKELNQLLEKARKSADKAISLVDIKTIIMMG